jgi:hypothetical protein
MVLTAWSPVVWSAASADDVVAFEALRPESPVGDDGCRRRLPEVRERMVAQRQVKGPA